MTDQNEIYWSGGGSEADPYLIEKERDLEKLCNSNESFEGIYFRQTADLSWNTEGSGEVSGIRPIGNLVPFAGNYDGGWHRVEGIVFDNLSFPNQGLFGSIHARGSVKNLGVSIEIRKENQDADLSVGGLAGTCAGRLENCYSICRITAVGKTADVGGITGYLSEGGSMLSCFADGDINGQGSCRGGLAGAAGGTIQGCYFKGNLEGTDKGWIGGLVGELRGKGALCSCYSLGKNQGDGKKMGGIIGSGNEDACSHCYYWDLGVAAGKGGRSAQQLLAPEFVEELNGGGRFFQPGGKSAAGHGPCLSALEEKGWEAQILHSTFVMGVWNLRLETNTEQEITLSWEGFNATGYTLTAPGFSQEYGGDVKGAVCGISVEEGAEKELSLCAANSKEGETYSRILRLSAPKIADFQVKKTSWVSETYGTQELEQYLGDHTDGFLSMELLQKSDVVPVGYAVKGGGGGGGTTKYGLACSWQVAGAQKIWLLIDGKEAMDVSGRSECTVETDRSLARLEAQGAGGYRVFREKGVGGAKYRLRECSWDLTAKCNLNCLHCCEKGRPAGRELSWAEGLDLIVQMDRMGVERVCFTGGEPLMQEAWERYARELSGRGIRVSMITNGMLLDERTAVKIGESGIRRVDVSVDGPEEIHDAIRAPGSFKACRRAFAALWEKAPGVERFAVTTLMRNNVSKLWELKSALEEMGVQGWQLQPGIPIGGLHKEREQLLSPEEMEDVIDFCYSASERSSMRICPAHNIGYYTVKETVTRKRSHNGYGVPAWSGCEAGISKLHITSDGTILGMSMCIDHKTEGNLRKNTLQEIWEGKDAFCRNREFDRRKMEGVCRSCQFVQLCRGGCFMMRYAWSGNPYGENAFCSYAQYLKGNREPVQNADT